MNDLTATEILESKDFGIEKISVKEWGGNVYIRAMSVEDRIQWEKSLDEKAPGISASTLLSYTLCDKEGTLLFKQGDIDKLKKKNAKVVLRLHTIAARINGLRQKDVEEMIKNSEAPQAD